MDADEIKLAAKASNKFEPPCMIGGTFWEVATVQKQHYTPAELNNTLNQATTMDSTSSSECRRIAEAFPFEAHEQVQMKRGICARGPHPVSEENPMPMPEFTDRLSALAGGAKNQSYLIDPFGQLSAVHGHSTMSKKVLPLVSAIAGNLKPLVAPWENPEDVDSTIMLMAGSNLTPSAMTVAERTPSLTGDGAIL
jgi:hypothetical protein